MRDKIQHYFWKPVYDRMARLYDGVDWFTANTTHRLRKRVLDYLPPPDSRLLEIGFGSGKLHLELVDRYTMYGLDQAPGMANLTKRRLAKHGHTSGLCIGSAYALPWPDGYFDAVFSTFAFSALTHGDLALGEMIRVLRPGGKVIVVDAGEAMNQNFFAYSLAKLWEAFGDYIRDETKLMQAHGLTVEREDYGPGHCVHISVGTRPS
jgi:ubiquinone/menaquinone biosynthesis C-methylase UbiE